jgi:hypothetical protein
MAAAPHSLTHKPLRDHGAVPLLAAAAAAVEAQPAIAEAAIWTLAHLATTPDGQAAVGGSDGLLPALCAARHAAPLAPGAAAAAAAAVRNLAVTSDDDGVAGPLVAAQDELAGVGALEPLVALLWRGSPQGCEAAAGAIRALCDAHPGNAAQAVQYGALEPLALLLREGTVVTREEAARALAHLATDADAAAAAMRAGALAPLAGLLWQDSLASSRDAAAIAIARLTAQLPRAQSSVAAAGAVGPLVTLLRDGPTVGARALAAGAVWRLAACNGPVQAEFLKAGIVPPLVALLQVRNQGALTAAACDAEGRGVRRGDRPGPVHDDRPPERRQALHRGGDRRRRGRQAGPAGPAGQRGPLPGHRRRQRHRRPHHLPDQAPVA